MRVVGLSGGLSRPSRTLGLVQAIHHHLEQRPGVVTTLLDFADCATAFGAVLDRRDLAAEQAAQLAALEAADIVVIAAPVFKAAYPGLFKHFFDLLDRQALDRKAVILAANGASAHHALIIESHLRPLASSLGGYTVPTGIYSQTSDFSQYALTNPDIHARIADAVSEAWALQGLLRRPSPVLPVGLNAA
ncbi:MAG TPA: NAD(P)H-dependent oxidoreductase [Fluviicoccus sp.]|nr:NAD(P)H-dependent oxidoreductase [Fluviicoccus sp.]